MAVAALFIGVAVDATGGKPSLARWSSIIRSLILANFDNHDGRIATSFVVLMFSGALCWLDAVPGYVK